MAIREGRWDCPTCGSIGLRGTDKACPNCGNSRPEGIRFYLPHDEPEVQDEQKLSRARVGADWLCEYCGASNPADAEICNQCAAPRGKSPSQEIQQFTLSEVPRDGDIQESSSPADKSQTARRGGSRRRSWTFGCLALILAATGIFIWLSISKKDLAVTVQKLRWERTIEVEKLVPVEEQDWSLPAGAKKLSEKKEVHHTNKVVDHYQRKEEKVNERVQVGTRTYVCGQKDLGNGFFEDIECTEPVYETRSRTETRSVPVYREEPVYQTRFRYRINKWIPARTERAGGSNQNPEWPSLKLKEQEREAKRSESYWVLFVDSQGNTYDFATPRENWNSYKVGDRYILKLNRVSGKIDQVTHK